MPYQLMEGHGSVVAPVDAFFAELQTQVKPASTVRSYGMDPLWTWRFLTAWEIAPSGRMLGTSCGGYPSRTSRCRCTGGAGERN